MSISLDDCGIYDTIKLNYVHNNILCSNEQEKRVEMSKSVLIRIAKSYYEDNMSQQEIANTLGISRMTISRMLQKAREEKIVEIKIHDENSYIELEDRIRGKYGLKEVVIAPTQKGADLKKVLSEAAAALFMRIVKNKDIVAVGWGSTIAYIPQYIKKAPKMNVTFVPMIGGYGQAQLHFHANQIASGMAEVFGGTAYYLHAPAMVDNVESKAVFLQNDEIKNTLALGEKADIAIIGIGSPFSEGSTLFDSGYFKEDDMRQLKEEGAECDIVSCIYLNKEGQECSRAVSQKVIGISGDCLKEIPLVIGTAGGKGKHHAIDLALKSRYIDIIVTDEETGNFLAGAN